MSDRSARPSLRPARRLPVRALWAGALSLALVLGLMLLAPRLPGVTMPGAEPPEPPGLARAETLSRRAAAAATGAERVWRALIARAGAEAPDPVAVVAFVGLTPSPCAGAALATGPFHCAETRSAEYDLGFLDQLALRLRREGETGVALFAARIAAAPAAAALAGRGADVAARAAVEDCLVGLWAARPSAGLGAVAPELYGRTLAAARRIVEAGAPDGAVRPDAPGLLAGDLAAREAAFAQGLAAGSPGDCGPAA